MIKRRRLPNSINHERWLVSYADLVTLLFAVFVVMYSISQVSEAKYKQLSSVLEQVFTKQTNSGGKSRNTAKNLQAAPQHFSVLQEVERNVLEALADLVSSKDAIVEGTESWVEIALNANLLFDSGSAQPTARAQQAFSKIAELLAPLTNEVSVAGHTDNQPIHTQAFANNWQLSTARAIQVVEVLVDNGVAPERLSAIGYGEFRPVADNNTERGRLLNRRVVLRVSKDSPKESWKDASNVSSASIPYSSELSSEADSVARTGESKLMPVRLQDGGLLFTSEPSEKPK